jgi:hypothetical protein
MSLGVYFEKRNVRLNLSLNIKTKILSTGETELLGLELIPPKNRRTL